MSNYYDKFYGYTGFFPILEDTESSCGHTLTLRETLSRLEIGENSIFSKTGLVHGARIFILDDVVYNGHPTKEEHLQYNYLVFSMTFDGELDALAKRISATVGQDWDSIFSHCYGFSSQQKTSESILEFLKKGQITTSFLYVDAAGDLQTTLRALIAQNELASLVANAQFLDSAARKTMVLELAEKLSKNPDPIPGEYKPQAIPGE